MTKIRKAEANVRIVLFVGGGVGIVTWIIGLEVVPEVNSEVDPGVGLEVG